MSRTRSVLDAPRLRRRCASSARRLRLSNRRLRDGSRHFVRRTVEPCLEIVVPSLAANPQALHGAALFAFASRSLHASGSADCFGSRMGLSRRLGVRRPKSKGRSLDRGRFSQAGIHLLNHLSSAALKVFLHRRVFPGTDFETFSKPLLPRIRARGERSASSSFCEERAVAASPVGLINPSEPLWIVSRSEFATISTGK